MRNMSVGRRPVFERPSPEGWKRIMAGMLKGMKSHLARSAPKRASEALDAVSMDLAKAGTPSQRKRVAARINRLLDSEPCYRAARKRYVRKTLGLALEQFDILMAELRRQAGME